MQTKGRRQRLRELRATAGFGTRLGRVVALELGGLAAARGRAYRPQRTLKLGAGAVALTAAGIAAARIRRHSPETPVDASDDTRA